MDPISEYFVQLFIIGPALVALVSIPAVAGCILLREGSYRLGCGFLGFSLVVAALVVQTVRHLVG